jgi:hypothetical protein
MNVYVVALRPECESKFNFCINILCAISCGDCYQTRVCSRPLGGVCNFRLIIAKMCIFTFLLLSNLMEILGICGLMFLKIENLCDIAQIGLNESVNLPLFKGVTT